MKARVLEIALAPQNRKWWTLFAVSFGLFMIMLDNTVVNVALPSIRSSLHIGQSELEWIVDGYALSFATFMLTGGKLADLFGRRRMFIVGLAIFTAASLACGLAASAGFLIAARVVQGVGAALMNPATLSIITATFPPRQRGMAIGIWAGVSAMALAIGPLVGGLLTEHVNWSWIFFINIPVGVLGDRRRRWSIDETRDTSREQRLDLPGLLDVGDRPVRAHLRADRGEQLRLDVRARSSRLFARRGRRARRRSSCSSCASGCRCSTSRSSGTRRSPARTRSMLLVGARDVRRVLLHLALHPEHPRLLADPDRARRSCR